MKQFTRLLAHSSLKNEQKKGEKESFAEIEKKERRLSIGIYALIIIITISLMLIIYTLIIKG